MSLTDKSYIKDLIKYMGDSDLTEIAVEADDVKITLKRECSCAPVVQHVAAPAPQYIHAAPAVAAAPAPAATEAPAKPAEDPNLHYVTAPLVGTFYMSPAPDAPPYIQVGDRVKKGQILCIVEAMKLMNEIESDVNGTIVEIICDNATPVEYGTKIFGIKLD